MPVLPGELLVKRYRIVSLLGSGQSGAVYRAWDSADKRDVALKELRDDDPETQQLFREEARRLSRVQHPQLPRVFDHFTWTKLVTISSPNILTASICRA